MGAGSSAEQRSPEQPEAGSGAPAEPEPQPRGGSPVAEAAPAAPGEPDIAAADPATKLLQKNGQLSTLNGLAEQEELTPEEGALSVQEEEVIVPEVGQQESEDVNARGSDKEMAANSPVAQDIAKEGQEEMPEMMEQIPSSESNLEELTQPAEPQTNDVGFKKVFKFVGFRFTVKKDKNEKSDAVQLLTVRKEEGEGAGESDGAGDHQEPSREAEEATPKESELKQSTENPEDTLKPEQSGADAALQAQSGPAAEEGRDGEEQPEKEPAKPPDSPTSPVAGETASPFKKFFTQGWTGWRKKTSFRKPKEDEPEAPEKKREQEPERGDAEEREKADDAPEKLAASAQPLPQEAADGVQGARLSAEYEKVELPPEGQGRASPGERPAPLATEIFDEKVEIVAEVHVSTAGSAEEQKAGLEDTEEPAPAEKAAETNAEPREAEPPVCASGGDPGQPPEASPDEKAQPSPPPPAQPEGIVSEAEMLASQERVKVQGSPLKKLFTSTGLKKLSGKKQKARRGGEEEAGEPQTAQADSPGSPEEQKGESSASSPEEPEEITCLERGIAADAQPEGEGEEGAASDGEKRREGVTPWASFKKMVTPKKRVRRPSESDKEEEAEKGKSATLSSTESAASEPQEEGRGHGEEPRPEEPKRKVDTSVSWEALICVGSSKKRARKASSSDEDEGARPAAAAAAAAEGPKAEDAGKDRDAGPDASAAPAGSHAEHDQGQGGSSPEPAGSPSEGEGVSTWESFKRLVTPRKKPKSRPEEKTDDPGAGAGAEHAAAAEAAEPGKEESWVSIKKFIPGRRRKRADGKQDHAAAEDAGPAGAREDDPEVPAVVPLSEYEAVEREKMEAQEARRREEEEAVAVSEELSRSLVHTVAVPVIDGARAVTGMDERPPSRMMEMEEEAGQRGPVAVSEELSKGLVHTVAVAVVDGARAVTSMEERSPSWISASATGPLDQAEEEAGPSPAGVLEREVEAGGTPITQALPESRGAAGEVELTSEASVAEETAEASAAEETTDMVSAVSQLSESLDTTEEATPVQEAEGGQPDGEAQQRRTQEVLRAVAERVGGEASQLGARGPGAPTQATRRVGSQLPGVAEAEPEEEEEVEEEEVAPLQGHAGETKREPLPQGEAFRQAAPEHAEEVARVPVSIGPSELAAPSPAETSVGLESELVLGQSPDSAGMPPDSEASGCAPVADSDALRAAQQDRAVEAHAEREGAPGVGSPVGEAQAAAARKETPPAASGLQPWEEEEEEHSGAAEGPERAAEEGSVETVPALSKAEGAQAAGQPADGETEDVPFAEGLEIAAAQKESAAGVALEEEVTEEADGQSKEDAGFPSPAQDPRAPVEGEAMERVEREARASQEKPEPKPVEVLSTQLVHTVRVAVTDGEKDVARLEESSPGLIPKEVLCTDIQVQSSEASPPVTAAVVERKVFGETRELLETAGPLEPAGAHLDPEPDPSYREGVRGQPGQDAAPAGTKPQAASAPTAPAEGVGSTDPEGERPPSQGGPAEEEEDGGEQASRWGVGAREAREEGFEAEEEISQLKSESHKLVQNVIQTAVDQVASTEDTADGPAPAPAQLTRAAGQEAEQKTGKEEGEPQGPAEAEAAPEESALTTAGQTPAGVPEGAAAPQVRGSPCANNAQRLEELALPTPEKREATGAKSVPELGESEAQEDEKRDAADFPENQISALVDPEASGDLTKEPPDANGPKLREKEAGFQEGKGQSEPGREIKTQTPEETAEQERQPAVPGLAEA